MKNTIIALALAASLAGAPALAAEPAVGPVLEHYAALVHANYSDTLTAARRMQAAIDAFLVAPSAQTQQAARDAWRAAREFYGQTEAFRFYGGPIDDEK
ncbi:MAG: iron-regulated protein, partial [Thiobacillus sp.]|nr:iron-regulated protein [Thiobacillus sp.]